MKIVTNKEYADPFVYFNGIQAGSNWTYENPAVYDPSVGHITQSLAFYGFTSPSQYFILSVQGNVDYAMYATNGLYAHAKVYVYDYFNHSIDDIENLTNSMLQGELNETSTVLIRLEHPMMLLAVISPITGDYDSIGSPIQISFSNQPNEVNPEPHYIIDWGNRIDGSCWNVAGKVYASKCLSDMPRRYVPGYQKIPILTLGIYKKIILSDIEVTGSTDFADAFGDDESYDDYDVVHDMSFDYRYNNASVPEELRYQSFMCKIATSFYANDSGDYYFNISQCDKSYVILNGQSIFFEQSGSFISSVKEGYNDLTIYCNYLHSVDTPSEEYSKAYFDFYPSFSATYYIPNDWDYDKQLTASGILEGATVQRLYTGEDTLIESDHSVPLPFIACSDGITIGMDIMLLDEWIEPESSSSGESGSSSSSEESSSSGSEGDYVYDSYDVTTSDVTLYTVNIDLSDYQYNTDGLNAVVLPMGYKSISGTKDSIRLADFIYDTYGIAVNGSGNLLTQNPNDNEYYVYDEDTDWTMASGFYTNYNCNENGYAIKTGALYYITYDEYDGLMVDRIGNDTDWTAISGYSATGEMTYCWAFGIRGGKLYSLKGSIATQLGEATNWTVVTGFAYYEDIENGYKMSIAYGIAGGKLYKIYVSNYSLVVEQVGSDTDWQQVSGYGYLLYTGGSYYEQDSSTEGSYYEQDSSGSAFGIRNGMLYELNNLTRIDLTMNSWCFVVMVEPNEAVAIDGTPVESSSSSEEESSSSSEEPSSSSAEASSSSSESSSSSSEVASSSSEEESSSSSEEASSSSEESSSGESSSSSEEASSSSELGSSSSSSEQSVYSSFDITGTDVTLSDSNINLSDYQYNEDGLDLQVLPDGYKAISGASAGMSFPIDYYPDHIGIDDNGMLRMEYPAAEFSWVIDSDTTWAKVSGICAATSEEDYAYATKTDGTLWAINFYEGSPVIQQVGVDGGWTDISGYSDDRRPVSAFGICDGALYHLIGTTATRIGISSSWTAVTGFSRSDSGLHTCLGFGIDAGNLYTLASASPSADPTASLLDSGGVWTKVSGFGQVATSNGHYMGDYIWSTVYGIRDGNLMGIVGGYTYSQHSPLYTIEVIDDIRTYHNVWLKAAGATSTESTGIAISKVPVESSSGEESSSSSEQSVYSSFDVTSTGVTLFDSNINLSDYQYNTDGLNAVVLPMGYKSISGTKDSIRLADFIYDTYGIAVNGSGNLLTQNPNDNEYYVYDEDTDWTMASGFYTNYNCNENGYAIKTGALYYITYDEYDGLMVDRIGNDTDWTAISGYSATGEMTYCWAFGIRGGKLYSLKGSIATQLGEATNWTVVTGFAYYEDIENGYKMSIAYGIAGGKLYKIYVSNYSLVVEQVGSDTDWQQVSGYGYLLYTGGSYYEQDSSTEGSYYEQDSSGSAFGIRNGMLYELNNLTRIDLTMNSWCFVVMVEPNEAVALTSASATSSSSEGSGSIVYQGLIEPDGEISNWSTLLFHGRGIVIRRAGKNTITIETANDYQMASFNVPCGEWVGIFITFDSNVTTWFVDRKADAVHISNAHATSSEPLYVGFSLSDGGIDYLSSSDMYGEEFYVKNVIAINKLLKQNEINRLYNARA